MATIEFARQSIDTNKVRRTSVVFIVSHYHHDIPCQKYNYIFEFVKVMSKVLSVLFSGHGVYKLINRLG